MKPLRTLLSIAGLLLLCSGVALGGEAKELTSKELFAKVSPAVIKIHTYNAEGKAVSQGSGFFVSAGGLLVTNYHVIAKAVSAKVLLSDGKTLNVSGMAASLPGRDLALLKVETPKRSFLKVARKAPEVGSKVFAIGSPKGLTNTISEGLVSGYREFKSGVKLLQTSAPISPGSSGGPLLVNTGKVVGVTTASWRSGKDLNFAVPCNYVQALVLIAEKPKPLPGVSPAKPPSPDKKGVEKPGHVLIDGKYWAIPKSIDPTFPSSRKDSKVPDSFRDFGGKEVTGEHKKKAAKEWTESLPALAVGEYGKISCARISRILGKDDMIIDRARASLWYAYSTRDFKRNLDTGPVRLKGFPTTGLVDDRYWYGNLPARGRAKQKGGAFIAIIGTWRWGGKMIYMAIPMAKIPKPAGWKPKSSDGSTKTAKPERTPEQVCQGWYLSLIHISEPTRPY